MLKNKKIIIAGGTGFIGQSLIKYLGKENKIIILGRATENHESNTYNQKLLRQKDGYRVLYVQWNGKDVEEHWLKEIEGSDLIINLVGKSVNCRYHKKQKQEIIDSRTNATKAIGEAVQKLTLPPKLWINASSATIYKHELEKPNNEYTGLISDWKKDNMPYNIIDEVRHIKNKLMATIRYGKKSDEAKSLDYDFSVQVCKQWEKAFFEEHTPFTRKVALRTAITLGAGGIIIPYLNLCKFGLGGKHGDGNQMFSWVHEEDVAGMIIWLFENEKAEGVYNCVAPNAVSNKQFLQTLRKISGNVFGLPAPALLLELGAFLIRTETELMLKSRWVYPARALHEGFNFRFKTIEDAFNEIISHLKRKQYRLF